MRRSVWIFLASIFLPSLGLAWMAARSAEDQQVVLEHQQVIISQNITDALAQNIQSQMDLVRADFVTTTRQLLAANPSAQDLAEDFNGKLRAAWPLAELGFAVNLDGEIYSPKPYDGPKAQIFRTDNDRFLSNRENAEVYSFNSAGNFTQGFRNAQSMYAVKTAPSMEADLDHNVIAGEEPTQSQASADKQADFEKIREAAVAMKSAARQVAPQTVSVPVQVPPSAASGSAAIRDSTGLSASGVAREPAETTNQASLQDSLAGALDSSSDRPASSVAARVAPVDSSPSAVRFAHNESKSNTRGSGAQFRPETAPAAPTAAASAAPQAIGEPNLTLSPPSSSDTAKTAASPAGDESTLAQASPPSMAPSGGAPAQASSTTDEAGTAYQSGASILKAVLPAKVLRQVVPQKMLSNDSEAVSNTVPEASDFRQVIGSETSGSLARFLEDKLRLMVWSHPDSTPIVFGAQLDQARLVETLKAAFQTPELQADSYACLGPGEYCVAILDDTGHPVALSAPDFKGDWKHPFVATEVGEALPHWEATLYLVDPQRTGRTARTLEATLGLIVLLLVAAIVSGGSLVAADVRRQMRLAQLKTDFVSNVSHELKTPLTSIRMFADLLAEKRVPDEQRQSAYLRIISAEAARLTRLINNVLDFARLERGAPLGEHRDCDLVDAVRDVVETCGPHLEAAGIAFRSEIEVDALPIRGDRDALAQIVLNLVSNAEKYGGGDVLVRVRRQETAGGALGCVDVLDRGAGIPAEKVRTIFEPFQRLDDSLASGVPGSGLGLTLARRMARAHGGEVTCSVRAGGGSCFTLTVPLRAA